MASTRDDGTPRAAIPLRQAVSRRKSWRMARWVTLMAVRSGSGQVFALAAGGGVVVTSRAWAGPLAADLRLTCGPVAVLPRS
jgi:hypothetical protein